MKICVIEPPSIPSYFNAGHHLHVFQLSSYLRQQGWADTVGIDAGALNWSWKHVADLLTSSKFEIVCVHVDYDGVDLLDRFIEYVREFSPSAKIILFGRLPAAVPEFFQRYDVNAIVYSGDPEASVESYLLSPDGCKTSGVFHKTKMGWQKSKPGVFLPPEKWALPNISEIPIRKYTRLYKDDLNKFCGIPNRHELVVPLGRGCPVGCFYCEVHVQQGKRDRRLSVDRTLEYIEKCMKEAPIEYVSFYAPTFTLDKRWVHEFCYAIKKGSNRFQWKCVTTIYHLDEALIAEMAEAGCVRISIGVETHSSGKVKNLPTLKQNQETKLRQIATWMRSYGVELNCFVILGLPGDSAADSEYTIKVVEELGGRVRPAIYTPYSNMKSSDSPRDLRQYNRQIFAPGTVGPEKSEFYRLLYDYPYQETRVFERIKKQNGAQLV